MQMRWKWIVGISVFLVIALMVTVYALLATYDYNKLKPRVARMVKDATGRELRLGGEINLAIGFSPSLVVTDVTFTNASWGSQPQMVKIEKLQAQVRLLPLLFKDVELKHIGLAGVDVLLETDSNGQGNWDFTAGDKSEKSFGAFEPIKIDIDSIRIENLHLGLIRRLFANERFPLKLSGKFSNAAVKIDGAIDDVLDLHGIALTAHASGTNLAALGRGMGIKLPKTSAFNVTGHLKGSKEALALEDLRGNLSGSAFDLAISGSFGDLIALSGLDLQLKGSGKDLAQIGKIIGEKLPATDDFTVQGRLTGSAKVLSLSEAQGSAHQGGLSLALDGGIKDLLNFNGVDLRVKASGKDMAEAGAVIEQKLPATDEFTIQGRLTGSAKTLSLSEASGSASRGSLNLTLNGRIKDLFTFSGVDLKLKGSGKDLAEIGPIIDQKLPVTDQFAVQARLTGSTKALSLQGAQGSASRGSLSIALSGEVKDLIAFSGVDLKVNGSGTDLAEIGKIIDIELPATDEFAVQGRLTGSAKALSLKEAQGRANRGSLNLTLSGGIEELPALNGISFKLKASGKELAEIGPMVGAELPELGPFDVSAKLSGSAKAISLNEFSAMVDKSDFKGLAKVEFLKRPKITVRLESSVIDFTALMKSLEKDEQKPANEDKQKRRLFSDDPLPFDVLKKVDADILLKARNIHAKDARLEFGHLTLKLEDSDFSIDKLEATYKETKISGKGDENFGKSSD
jgi:uncharacterized protein involved in outer membrane biogenesis